MTPTIKIMLLVFGVIILIVLVIDSIVKWRAKNGKDTQFINRINQQTKSWLVVNMRNDIKQYGITKEELFDEKKD